MKSKVQSMVTSDMCPHTKGGDTPKDNQGGMGVPMSRIMGQSGCSSLPTSMYIDVPHSPGGYGLCMGWDHVCDSGIRGSAILSGEQIQLAATPFSVIVSGKDNIITGGDHNVIMGGESNIIKDGKDITILNGKRRGVIGGPDTDNTVFMANMHVHGSLSISERTLTWDDFYGPLQTTPGIVHTRDSDFLIVVDIGIYNPDTAASIIILEKGKPGQQLLITMAGDPWENNIRKKGMDFADEKREDEYYRNAEPVLSVRCPLDNTEYLDKVHADLLTHTYDHWILNCQNLTVPCKLDLREVPEWIYSRPCFGADVYNGAVKWRYNTTIEIDVPLSEHGVSGHVTVSITIGSEEAFMGPWTGTAWFIWSTHMKSWLVI